MKNSGNTTASLLLAHALADLKRHVFLTHISPQSSAFETYLGLADYEDKTTTPSQLVKLMREGAIQVSDIGDYCKNDVDFLHIFTNNKINFSQDDMHTLIGFIINSAESQYEYKVFDIDTDLTNPTAEYVLKHSDIIILNLNTSIYQLNRYKEMEQQLAKLFAGKKIILLVNQYITKVMKLKDVSKHLGIKVAPYSIRFNPWVQWSCNRGKLSYMYQQGKLKDGDVIDIFRDVTVLANGVAKAKVAILKQRMKEGKVTADEVKKALAKPSTEKPSSKKQDKADSNSNVGTGDESQNKG